MSMCSIAGVFHSDLVTGLWVRSAEQPAAGQCSGAMGNSRTRGFDREIPKKSSPNGGFPWENYQ
jgi:hypothetical protein